MDPEGRLLDVEHGRPIRLDAAGALWLVRAGTLVVFAGRGRIGAPTGLPRYVATCEPEDAVFAVAAEGLPVTSHLYAVPTGDARLLEVTPEGFGELARRDPPRAAALVERWVQKLGSAGARLAACPPPLGDPPRGALALAAGQAFRPDGEGERWVRITTGTARLVRLEAATLGAETGWVPLAGGLWLEAVGPAELLVVTTAELGDPGLWLQGLARLHALAQRLLLAQAEVAERAAAAALGERRRRTRQTTGEALGELTALLAWRKTPPRREGAPLLLAASLVAEALGAPPFPAPSAREDGRTTDAMDGLASAGRLRARRVTLRGAWWAADGGPLVGYVAADERPVALLPTRPGCYELVDPSQGGATRVDAMVATTVARHADVLYRPLPEGTGPPRSLLAFSMRGRARDWLLLMLTGVAATVLGFATPQAFSLLVDHVFPRGDRVMLWHVGLGLLAAALGLAVLEGSQGVFLTRLRTASGYALQTAVWDRLLRLRPAFFRGQPPGDLLARVTAIDRIWETVSGSASQTVLTGSLALLNFLLLAYYSRTLALVALAICLVTIGITTGAGMVLLRRGRLLLRMEGQLSGLVLQLVGGIAKLRVAGGEERAFARWARVYAAYQRSTLSTQRVADLVTVFNHVLPAASAVALFAIALPLVRDPDGPTGLTTGALLGFYAAFGALLAGSASLSNAVIDGLDAATLWERARPIVTAPVEVRPRHTDPGRLAGRIRLDGVSFRYRPGAPLALDRVTLRADPGEFVALVGPSGSGKSTLLRLLLGFDEAEDGRIFYDDRDLAGLDIEGVRRQIGVVLQHGRLAAGSILKVVAAGGALALDEAWEALDAAALADEIAALPMGIHTVVSEGGTNLSGGQRQRLLIARALARQPRILLFDEATSALDNHTQALVSESLERLGITRLVIAHRFSTIRAARRIYVLQAGRVVEEGSFAALARAEGLFARLLARERVDRLDAPGPDAPDSLAPDSSRPR